MTRQTLYANIKSVNNVLTPEHLDTLDWVGLLRNCHPLDRPDFARQLYVGEKISKHECRLFVTIR